MIGLRGLKGVIGLAAFVGALALLFAILVETGVIASWATGMPIREVRELERLANKADRNETFTPQEVDRLAYFARRYKSSQHTVLVALLHLDCQPETIDKQYQLLREMVDSPDSVGRQMALIVLEKCNYPHLGRIAREKLNDPDERVRQTAQGILQRLSAGEPAPPKRIVQ